MSLELSILGVRGARGRFASMADVGLREAAYEESAELAHMLEERYRSAAPKSGRAQHDDGSKPFSESFHGTAVMTESGFEVHMETSQPEIAKFIEMGHGDIYPRQAGALHWTSASGEDVFAMHVGPVPPNDWRRGVREEVEPLLHEHGNRIGHRVVSKLAGKAVD